MTRKSPIFELIEKHRALEAEIRNNREHFISDWNGEHPFVGQFLGAELSRRLPESPALSRYIYFDEQHSILDAICNFHKTVDNLSLSHRNIMAGPGSSSILVALSLWLLQQGHEEVFYVPPLYYTLHFFLKTLHIHLRPVTGKHMFEPDCALNLPKKKTVLLLSDPMWYAGKRVSLAMIEMIADWQRKTGSLVIIDGAFQYTQWGNTRQEFSSRLDSDKTFRLISPTKSLAIPAFRFAYLLHPTQYHDNLLFLYESIVGGSTLFDVVFARRALKVLSGRTSNYSLTNFLQSTYCQLSKRRIFETKISPDCGYFIFAKPRIKLDNSAVMTEEFFELNGYPGYIRLNLMIAHRIYIEKRTVV